jgi:CDP-diacylglycerol--serine O-phosphatidyltransferase
MRFTKQIPNILTLLNLLAGTIAVMFAVKGELIHAALFVFIGIFFDFFDGLAARLLNVTGNFGKQLDSLADVVTSGVVPGIVMFQLLKSKSSLEIFSESFMSWDTAKFELLPYVGLLITLTAAYRLAKFNIDEHQTNSFLGLPVPAATLVVVSLPLILNYSSIEFVTNLIQNNYFLVGLTLLLCYLMLTKIPLFALKFKDYSWKNNKIKFIFILLTALCCILLKFIAIPLVILLYVLMSVIDNFERRNSDVRS